MNDLKEQRVLAGVDRWDREEARKPLVEFGMGGGPMHSPDPEEEHFKKAYLGLYGDLRNLFEQSKHVDKAKALHFLKEGLKQLDKGLWHLDD